MSAFRAETRSRFKDGIHRAMLRGESRHVLNRAATRNRTTLESARYDLYGTGQEEIAFGTTLGMYVTQ
jgi:hypothetical protein